MMQAFNPLGNVRKLTRKVEEEGAIVKLRINDDETEFVTIGQIMVGLQIKSWTEETRQYQK